ncbi:MAG: VOC family protein [Armatimonadetes bacterium]|nr:VOC family protein [Armatimonadota bacterium]
MAKPKQMQIILYVKDMAASVDFYRNKLGLEVTYPHHDGSLELEHWVTLDAGGASLALHAGGDAVDSPHWPAVSLIFDDLEQAVRDAMDRGADVGNIQEPHPGVLFATTSDPSGTVVFLKQAYRG